MFGRIVSSWSNLSTSSKLKIKILAGVVVLFLLVVLAGVLIYLLYSQETVKAEEFKTDGGLIFAQTLCRHGNRHILGPYPNDPWRSEEFWPGGFGALTNFGKRQHYELGQYLRKRYSTLLGDDGYSANKVYVWSSGTDRTLMSAQATLAGLFPPSGNELWMENLNWQPIPVHYESPNLDYRLVTEKQCDRYDYIMLEWKNTTEYTDLFQRYKPLITHLETNSGKKLQTLTTIFLLLDALRIEQSRGYRLPEWAEQVMGSGSDFEYLAFRAYAQWTTTTEMKKLRSGFLLKEILDRFTNKTQTKLSPDRSLWMYFGHDTTITNLLKSLELYTPHFPPTASCLFFELYQSDDILNPYVQIFYRNSTKTEVPVLEIPRCGVKCPLSKLYELYDDVLPKQEFNKECKLRDGESLPPGGNPEKYNV